MALTLPYPNISFVPLDVLTAEELNHVVANYTAIAAAFPVSSNNIADSSITNSKLNVTWTNIADLYYKSGDVISESTPDQTIYSQVLDGFITSSNTVLVFKVPVAKRLDNITNATLNSCVGDYRCAGGYLSGTGTDIVTQSTQTSAFISKATNSITFAFTKSGGWGSTNNSPVSLGIKTLTFTLS